MGPYDGEMSGASTEEERPVPPAASEEEQPAPLPGFTAGGILAETCPGVRRRARKQPRRPPAAREAAAAAPAPAATAAVDDAQGETQPASYLPGSPELPFHIRLSIQRADQNLLKLILLALHVSLLRHTRAEARWWVLAWRTATVAAFAGDLIWSMPARWRPSYLRWRDSIAAVLRFASFGPSLGSDAFWRQFNAAAPPLTAVGASPAALALHAGRLIIASGIVPLLMGIVALRTNLWCGILAQAGAVGSALWHARSGCGRPILSHPAAQAHTRALYRLLSMASVGLPLPLAPLAAPDPLAECATVVSFLQVLAFLLPTLVEAGMTARLFAAHQGERAAAGLPAERGARCAAYAAVYDFCCGAAGLPLGVLAWPAVAVAWDWPAFLHAHASSPLA